MTERERETEHEQGRGRERGRHRIPSRLQALSCQHRARRGARTHGPRDHDLSRSQTLNRLSHPGAPSLAQLLKYPCKTPHGKSYFFFFHFFFLALILISTRSILGKSPGNSHKSHWSLEKVCVPVDYVRFR